MRLDELRRTILHEALKDLEAQGARFDTLSKFIFIMSDNFQVSEDWTNEEAFLLDFELYMDDYLDFHQDEDLRPTLRLLKDSQAKLPFEWTTVVELTKELRFKGDE